MSRRKHVPTWQDAQRDRERAARERADRWLGVTFDPDLLEAPPPGSSWRIDNLMLESNGGTTYTASVWVRPATGESPWTRIVRSFQALSVGAARAAATIESMLPTNNGRVLYPYDYYLNPPPAWEHA